MKTALRLLICLAVLPFSAQAEDTILPSTVVVDVTGTDATDAKTHALGRAERDAFEQILRKFSPDMAPDIIAKATSETIGAIVRGTEVLEENISGNRYRATLKVNFSGDGIEKLLDDAAKPPPAAAEGGSGGVLVFPTFDAQGTLLLWEPQNEWRSLFARASIELGKGRVVVPFGDTNDSNAINAYNVNGASYEAMTPLLQRYGTGDVAVIHASIQDGDRPTLTVTQRLIGKKNADIASFTYDADEGESKTDLMARAARELATQLSAKSSADRDMAAREHAPGTPQMMVASISTLAAWTQLRSALNELPMIKRIDILAMAPRQVDIKVFYLGDAQTFLDALKGKGIRVVQNANYWVIGRE